MNKIALIAGLTLLGASPALAAKLPVGADGMTNIADCAKVPATIKNECISRSRPVTGKEIYAKVAAEQKAATAKAAVEAKAKAAAEAAKRAAETKANRLAAARYDRARVASAPKGLKVAADGSTDLATCMTVKAALREACLSRARALTGAELAAFTERQAAAAAKAAPKSATTTAAAPAAAAKAPAKTPAKAAAVAPAKTGKGFKIAKDGSTDIADCANANPEFKNECISRARALTGAALAAFNARQAGTTAAAKPASGNLVTTGTVTKVETKAKAADAATGKGFPVAKDGTTDIADCAKAKPDFKNECISRARPIKGADIGKRTGG